MEDFLSQQLDDKFEEIYKEFFDLCLSDLEFYDPKLIIDYKDFHDSYEGEIKYNFGSSFTKDLTRKCIKESIQYLVDKLLVKNDSLKIARSVNTSLENLKNDLGVFWSWKLDNACSWDGPECSDPILIIGNVKLASIDWVNTLVLNADYYLAPQETEIRLFPGEPVSVLSINGQEVNKTYYS